jgi:hypothetical protein
MRLFANAAQVLRDAAARRPALPAKSQKGRKSRFYCANLLV